MVKFVPFSICNFDCFSWHSLTDVSSSVSRFRSQSMVKLSTVNVFGCNFPNVSLSSMSVWSNWNTICVGGDVLFLVTNKLIHFNVWQFKNFKWETEMKWTIIVFTCVVRWIHDIHPVGWYFVNLPLFFAEYHEMNLMSNHNTEMPLIRYFS